MNSIRTLSSNVNGKFIAKESAVYTSIIALCLTIVFIVVVAVSEFVFYVLENRIEPLRLTDRVVSLSINASDSNRLYVSFAYQTNIGISGVKTYSYNEYNVIGFHAIDSVIEELEGNGYQIIKRTGDITSFDTDGTAYAEFCVEYSDNNILTSNEYTCLYGQKNMIDETLSNFYDDKINNIEFGELWSQ